MNESLKYVDIDKTIDNVFVDKITNRKLQLSANYAKKSNLFSSLACNTDFSNIAMTSDLNKLQAIQDMDAGGYTAVYQGLIQAAQYLYQEKQNRRSPADYANYKKRVKMILILTDGEENPYQYTFSNLVTPKSGKQGICEKIKAEFGDGDVPLYMGVIGINFQASYQTGFRDCVGAEHMMTAEHVDDLLAEMKAMISDAAQQTGVSKLQYRHTS